MCGITGYYQFNKAAIASNATIVEMLEVQRHRGPDDSGIVFFNLDQKSKKEVSHKKTIRLEEPFEGALGFNRLSIQDLSQHGHQPMMSNDGDVILTLNGEIYNAFDYKEELIASGYTFKSTSDTEVVLYLYLKYGWDKMLSMLNGMFAIVVVDLRSSEILIARDRFGIKPMYYYKSEDKIAFSSEIKSFYKLPGFTATFNKELLDEFLIFRNTRNESLIKEVQILEPGHYLRISSDGAFAIHQFFDINNYSRNPILKEKDQVLKDLAVTLNKSVESQLISDVKLGCQLSGGVDSSVVTYMANTQRKGENFEAVSIIFDNQAYSEEKYIDKVADQLAIEAHKFTMDATYYLNHLKKATWHLESPINHPNTLGIYLLAHDAKKYVTVLLSGEGADEVFGGYSRFHTMKYRYKLPFVKGLVKSFPKNTKQYLSEYQDVAFQAISGTAFMPYEMAKQLKPDFDKKKAVQPRKELYTSFSGSIFDKQVKYEIATYIPDLLIRQDKMSMAHSIENRVPFLDNEVVEKSFSYPEDMLIRKEKNHEKYVLKELCADYFGKEFAYRDKMGFGIPLRDFFKDKDFKKYLNTAIQPGILKRNLFDNNTINKLFQRIDTLDYKEMETLWVLITLEIWMQEFIDR